MPSTELVTLSCHRTEQFRQALRDHGLDRSSSSVARLHAFDSALRSWTLARTEQVELSLRGRLECSARRQFGSHWWADPGAFRHGFDHQAFLRRAAAVLDRAHDPATRSAWADRRHERVPFGMLAEELSLGELSRLVSGVEPRTHAEIAAAFRLPPPTLRSCLQHLTHVRNCCAHHIRLWGRRLRVPPPTFRSPGDLVHRLEGLPKRSPAHSLELVAHMAETTGPCDHHAAALRELFAEHDDLVDGLGGRPTWAAT